MTIDFDKMYTGMPLMTELAKQIAEKNASLTWMDMVKEFTQKSDEFLFGGNSNMDFSSYYDLACRSDERKEELNLKNEIIMDAKSLDDLKNKIYNADNTLATDLSNINGQLTGKIAYLNIYFGIDRSEEELRSSDLAILHILYKVFNDANLKKGILSNTKKSTFLRFYQNQYNPYCDTILFIRSCFLQVIGFKEAYYIEHVRRLIYLALNTTEDKFYENIISIMSEFDNKKKDLLRDIYVSSNVRKKLCNLISAQLESILNTKKYEWQHPASDNLTENEIDFIQAYFHFITLGVEDVVNKPLLSLKNTKRFSDMIDNGCSILPEFGEWCERSDLRDIINKNSLYIAQFIADEELDLIKDRKNLESRQANIKNHCDNYIKLCKFLYDTNILKGINHIKFLILIYLCEKCRRDKINIRKEGYQGGIPERKTISMKTVFDYVEKNDLSFFEPTLTKKFIEYARENIKRKENGQKPIDDGNFIEKLRQKDMNQLKRMEDANKVVDDKEVIKIYGLIAFGNTVESLYRGESKALLESRKQMRKYLYTYFKKTIPLLKQRNFPFKSLEDYREDILPQELLRRVVKNELNHCRLEKI